MVLFLFLSLIFVNMLSIEADVTYHALIKLLKFFLRDFHGFKGLVLAKIPLKYLWIRLSGAFHSIGLNKVLHLDDS